MLTSSNVTFDCLVDSFIIYLATILLSLGCSFRSVIVVLGTPLIDFFGALQFLKGSARYDELICCVFSRLLTMFSSPNAFMIACAHPNGVIVAIKHQFTKDES